MYLQNFRRYWKEQLTHAAVGAVAGYLLVSGHEWAGMGILALVIARQGLEWGNRALLPALIYMVRPQDQAVGGIEAMKRRDSPGIDLAYHLGGCLLGIGAGMGVGRWV